MIKLSMPRWKFFRGPAIRLGVLHRLRRCTSRLEADLLLSQANGFRRISDDTWRKCCKAHAAVVGNNRRQPTPGVAGK